MMKRALRSLVGVVAGLAVSFLLVVAVELASGVVHPLPEDFGGTTEEMCAHVERYPAWVLAAAVFLWAIAAFAGTWVARRIGGLVSWAIVGLLILAALVFNVSMLPYPIWFKVSTLLAIPAAMAAAGGAFRRRGESPWGEGGRYGT